MGSADPNGRDNWMKEKRIMNDIIEKPKDAFVKYGVVETDPIGSIHVPLGVYEDEKKLKESVKKIPFKERRNLDEGIKNAGNEFEKNGRPEARKIMIVFIDGKDVSTVEELKKVTEPLKKKNVKIIPVVLEDNVDKDKLKPLLHDNKKAKKGKDPKKLADEVSEETFNGKRRECEHNFIYIIMLYHCEFFTDPCFAVECKACVAKPDDSTTCGMQ